MRINNPYTLYQKLYQDALVYPLVKVFKPYSKISLKKKRNRKKFMMHTYRYLTPQMHSLFYRVKFGVLLTK